MMIAITEWINKNRWKQMRKSLFHGIIMKFLTNGYVVDCPRYQGNHSLNLDLRVRRVDGTHETYFKFIDGGLVGCGTVTNLCEFVETMNIRIIVIVNMPLGSLELEVFNDWNIKVLVCPTDSELYSIVNNP